MLETLLNYVRRHHIGLLALFIALGGVSYAAVNLPKNSVGTKQLRKGAVTNAKVRNGSITSAKVRNGSITSAKVRNGSLLRRDFRKGQLPRGPAGPRGATGLPGAPGPAGATGATGPSGGIDLAAAGRVSHGVFWAGEETFTEDDTTFEPFATATIDAPANGFLMVTTSANIHPSSGGVVGTCTAQLMPELVGGPETSSTGLSTFTEGDISSTFQNLAVSDVFAVQEGTATVHAMIRMNPFTSPSCDATLSLGAPALTVLWVPFAGT